MAPSGVILGEEGRKSVKKWKNKNVIPTEGRSIKNEGWGGQHRPKGVQRVTRRGPKRDPKTEQKTERQKLTKRFPKDPFPSLMGQILGPWGPWGGDKGEVNLPPEGKRDDTGDLTRPWPKARRIY